MLSVDDDADAAVEARVCKGWNEFRQLVPLLTSKNVSLLMRWKLHTSCVCSRMLHNEVIGSRPSDHYFRSVCLSVCLFLQSFSQPS